MSQRIIFLDFDGVLNSTASWVTRNHLPALLESTNKKYGFSVSVNAHEIDPAPVVMIRKFCKAYDVKIVVSSTWRRHFTIESLSAILKQVDSEWSKNLIIDTTPVNDATRGKQIADWLLMHPDVTQYVIIDDSDFDIDDKDHLLKTASLIGFSFVDFVRLHHMFGLNPRELAFSPKRESHDLELMMRQIKEISDDCERVMDDPHSAS